MGGWRLFLVSAVLLSALTLDQGPAGAGGRLGSVFVPQAGPSPFNITEVPPGNAYSLNYQSYLGTPSSGYVPFWYSSLSAAPGYSMSPTQPWNGRGDLFAPSFQSRPDNRARLRLRLPAADAEVWVEGKKTAQKGTIRYFYSPPLTAGTYAYDVEVKWTANGKAVEEKRTLRIRPNTWQDVDFTPPAVAKTSKK